MRLCRWGTIRKNSPPVFVCLAGARSTRVDVELSFTALVHITGMTDALPEPGFRSERCNILNMLIARSLWKHKQK